MRINPRVIYLSIFFTVLVVMTSNIVVADASGAGKLTKVASNVAPYSNPIWSPDGKEILFAKGAGNYGANLYKVLSNGSGEKKLASDTCPGGYSWSPDGSKISYYQFTDEIGSYNLSLINADGTDNTQLLGPVNNLFFYI
jgi:Tol biopolymer transport system component